MGAVKGAKKLFGGAAKWAKGKYARMGQGRPRRPRSAASDDPPRTSSSGSRRRSTRGEVASSFTGERRRRQPDRDAQCGRRRPSRALPTAASSGHSKATSGGSREVRTIRSVRRRPSVDRRAPDGRTPPSGHGRRRTVARSTWRQAGSGPAARRASSCRRRDLARSPAQGRDLPSRKDRRRRRRAQATDASRRLGDRRATPRPRSSAIGTTSAARADAKTATPAVAVPAEDSLSGAAWSSSAAARRQTAPSAKIACRREHASGKRRARARVDELGEKDGPRRDARTTATGRIGRRRRNAGEIVTGSTIRRASTNVRATSRTATRGSTSRSPAINERVDQRADGPEASSCQLGERPRCERERQAPTPARPMTRRSNATARAGQRGRRPRLRRPVHLRAVRARARRSLDGARLAQTVGCGDLVVDDADLVVARTAVIGRPASRTSRRHRRRTPSDDRARDVQTAERWTTTAVAPTDASTSPYLHWRLGRQAACERSRLPGDGPALGARRDRSASAASRGRCSACPPARRRSSS